MQDRCRIGAYRSTLDGYNNPVAEYVYGELTACGLQLVRPDEVQGSGEVPEIGVELRLPLGTTLDTKDRIMVTHRYGEALETSQIYEVVGPVKRGPSGLVVRLALSNS